MRNKKIRNLFYAGQLTVPGPGVPPAIISGKIAAEQLIKHLNSFQKATSHEIRGGISKSKLFTGYERRLSCFRTKLFS